QNANHSVRVTDDFMRAVVEDKDWWTKNVHDGQPVEKLRARDLMMKIAESTWHCGDPGMQYDTTVNRWHTSKSTARINASNPCSEYMFLDDTACNLASLTLMKFVTTGGQFDVPAFMHAVDATITAQEILVGTASRCSRSSGCTAKPCAASNPSMSSRNCFWPPRNPGTRLSITAKSSASRIPRSLCWRPPAPLVS